MGAGYLLNLYLAGGVVASLTHVVRMRVKMKKRHFSRVNFCLVSLVPFSFFFCPEQQELERMSGVCLVFHPIT